MRVGRVLNGFRALLVVVVEVELDVGVVAALERVFAVEIFRFDERHFQSAGHTCLIEMQREEYEVVDRNMRGFLAIFILPIPCLLTEARRVFRQKTQR